MKGMRKIWDNHKVIGEVQKSESTKVVFTLGAIDGVKYISLRGWYKTKKEQEWKPGRDGISIPVKLPINMEITDVAISFANVFNEAIAAAADFPLHDPANELWIEKYNRE